LLRATFGKTYLCIARLVAWAISKPGSLNWYVTANYRMAKQIAWRQLKTMVPSDICIKRNESELSVELSNGSIIALKGAENADSLRGVSLSTLVIDEAAYVKQDAWEMVLRPALVRSRRSRMVYYHTRWAELVSRPMGTGTR
jgi:hypothetical protein